VDSCLIRVRVTPRSGRDEVIGWQDDVLRVRVRAAPVEGQANEALCRLIAKQAGVPYSAVEVVLGASARTKTLRITGLTEDEARSRLGRPRPLL
jgi:uncharacterized protein (TIGR00251 family)